MPFRFSRLLLSLICLSLVLLALVAGLWPLDFFPANRVRWIRDRFGLEFEGNGDRKDCKGGGAVQTRGPLAAAGRGRERSSSVAVELWLKPFRETKGCRARILSFYDNQGNETFFVGQWRTHLLIRGMLRSGDGGTIFREIGVKDALVKGVSRFISIQSGDKGTDIYLRGRLVKQYPKVRLINSVDELSGLVVRIGNTIDATGAWAGQLYGLAFYRRVLTPQLAAAGVQWWAGGAEMPRRDLGGDILALYRFDEGSGSLTRSAVPGGASFYMPARFLVEKKLLKVSNPFHHKARDLLVNFFGFVPVGFFFCLRLAAVERKRFSLLAVGLIAVAAGMLLSFCIEWAQVYLPTRDSSLTDLAVNTLGTVAGVVWCVWKYIRLRVS